MIDNRDEYQSMFEVEQRLWWYQVLHRKTLRQIIKHFGTNATGLRILDAACGTGGLLSYLRQQGFTRLTGFDYSPYAVDFSQERQLDVSFGDLRDVGAFRPQSTYDVIICNDALYFLTDAEIEKALISFKERLSDKGIILINIHAFNAFKGTHDLAVGSTRRFTLGDFKRYTKNAELHITAYTYWPFFLSIPILAVRQWQRFRLRSHSPAVTDIKSDVRYPGNLVNSALGLITRTEQVLLRRAPFGSSLFLALKKPRF